MRRTNWFAALLLAAPLVLGSPAVVDAADHLDAPSLTGNGQRDINDLYAFQSPSNPNNAVFIITVNPFAGVRSPTTFGDDVVYDLLIDNTGDGSTDITYSTTFEAPTSGRQQNFVMTRNGSAYASGTANTGTAAATSTGGKVQADVFDDPFFFDVAGFRNNFNFTGTNGFANADNSAIVLEVPRSELGSNTLALWTRTTVGGVQTDREGRPAINTALIPVGRKDEFNQTLPENDRAVFGDTVRARIAVLNGGDADHAASLADILLPDVITFDPSNPAGFLNGRRLEDDVIDAELSLLTKGAITTDNVNGNDRAFRSAFPYLAAPQIIPLPAAAWMGLGLLGALGGGSWLRNRSRRGTGHTAQ